MAWLESFRLTKNAEFVLNRLFGLRLSVVRRAKSVAIALPHLEKQGYAPEASHLLKGCLLDRALDPDSARLVVQYGLAWTKNNPPGEGADYVLIDWA